MAQQEEIAALQANSSAQEATITALEAQGMEQQEEIEVLQANISALQSEMDAMDFGTGQALSSFVAWGESDCTTTSTTVYSGKRWLYVMFSRFFITLFDTTACHNYCV